MKAKWIAYLLLSTTLLLIGAVTYSPPTPLGSRTNWQTVRYSTPVQGLMTAVVDTTTQSNQTITLDPNLSGYLDRITITHDGNDVAWSCTVRDTDSVTLWSKADLKATNDHCSYNVSFPDSSGNAIPGVPFIGGLSVVIANADTTGATATAIHVKLYIWESWRR
jgi:hypothetical protein